MDGTTFDDESDDPYERKKNRERNRQRKNSAATRDIAASCPKCVCTETRDRILADLLFALKTLFPERFGMEFGQDQLDLVSDLQNAIEVGDQAARAMPRGTGKTSTLIGAVIWAILKGIHPFVALIAATGEAATELLEQITTYFETNEQLLAYFPELVHPIRMLEGIRQRRLLWNGEPIKQEWKKNRIILPNVKGAHGAGTILKTAGITGRIRGMNYQRRDGTNVRPTLALVDDPQTDKSAVSLKENNKRELTLCETIPGLAGPGKKISVLVACTVIAPDDLADRILSRDKHPEFHGKRTKLLYGEAKNKDLWNQYAEILRECLRGDESIERATAFYIENQETMDAGLAPAWPARFNDDEASAIQFAMNLKILKPGMFAAEYQNEPLVLVEVQATIDPDDICRRLSGYARNAIPLPTEYLTAGIDVQKHYLVYFVLASEPNSTGYCVDYGTWPDQRSQYYDRRSSTRTIEAECPNMEESAQVWAALEALCSLLFSRQFTREDQSPMSVRKACIDIRYNGELIKRFVKQSAYKEMLLPAQGIYIPPGAPGINDRPAAPGEISKHGFRLPPLKTGQITRTASFDSAEYIGKVHDALGAPMGAKGTLTLFNAEPHQHRCCADQLCAEMPVLMTANNGKPKRMFRLKPGGPDNDYLDAAKLAVLAGYVLGMEPSYIPPKPAAQAKPQKRPPKFGAI